MIPKSLLDKVDALAGWRLSSASDALEQRKAALLAELAELVRDAERYRWLRDNVSFHDIDHDYDVECRNVPVLAQVNNRLWYHATDDVLSDTLDAAIDKAIDTARSEGE